MSQKKQLQRLKLAEDERKLQTKRFVKQCAWKSEDGNHRLMKSGEKQRCLDGNVGAFLFYKDQFAITCLFASQKGRFLLPGTREL